MSGSPSQTELEPENTIKLESKEGEVFDVPREHLRHSNLIRNMLEDLGYNDENNETKGMKSPLKMANITSETLKSVLEWCEFHVDDLDNGDNEDEAARADSDNMPKFDKEFLRAFDQTELFELIHAANYLDIKNLLDNACKTVANMIKGKSPEEIRRCFNIKNDFSPEEEARLRTENAWLDE